jgi:23S rRNA pseudouridine2605 synthase
LATTAKAASARAPRRAGVSLERALSKLGLASRTEARQLIAAGRVHVDGRIATNPLARVVPERIDIRIDGVETERHAPVTLLLHKPRGYVTTRSDPDGRKTVYDLLAGAPARVVPVGRLDLATSGLLLLTNDTQFAHWLTDPKSAVPRVYLVTVRGRIHDETLVKLQEGIVDAGEPLAAEAVSMRKASGRETHLIVTLTEGRNREVRRLFAAVGHEVTRLRRVQFGGIELGDLAPGEWRQVDGRELRRAFPAYAPRKREPSPK